MWVVFLPLSQTTKAYDQPSILVHKHLFKEIRKQNKIPKINSHLFNINLLQLVNAQAEH